MSSARRVAEASISRNLNLSFLLSDVQPCVISMWTALVHGGWEPPNHVSVETYMHHKALRDNDDPMTAFVGYCCSFASKYYGGFARNKRGSDYASRSGVGSKSYASEGRNYVMQRADPLRVVGAEIMCCNYEAYIGTTDATFFLDPPYKDRTAQFSGMKFDHTAFWNFARELSKCNRVFVTEFIVPDDFVVIHNWGDTVVRHYSGRGSDGTNEVLVVSKHRQDILRQIK